MNLYKELKTVAGGDFNELKTAVVNLWNETTAEDHRTLISNLVCNNHSGKMSGMLSISGSVQHNEFCARNAQIEGSICQKCYAGAQLTRYKAQAIKQKIAQAVLESVALNADDVPFLNAAIFRLEAFGDIANRQQLENYGTIARVNDLTTFALWTKNLIDTADFDKPANMILIVSSLMINKSMNIDALRAAGIPADKVFTVYKSEETAAEAGAVINCGARHCATCRRCYSHGDTYVNELLK